MTWRPAKSLIVLRDEVNAAHPGRSKASDGTKGDAAHASRASDHNPDGNGVVHAIDITRYPGTEHTVERLRRMGEYGDRRIKYIIFESRIYSAKNGFKGAAYTGSNKHDKHFHLSVTASHGDDTGPWHLFDEPHPEPPPPVPPDQEDEDMPFIANPVTDDDPGMFFANNGKHVPLASTDEKQQLMNSGFRVRDLEPLAWDLFKATSTEVAHP